MGAGPLATQAVILAGGQGTRLRPLTLARAKPVVPLLNRPFLAYQIALLRQHGVTDVILSCSYRVDDVREALGDARELGVTLRYVIEELLDLPAQWADYKALNAEMSPTCPVITERKEPMGPPIK